MSLLDVVTDVLDGEGWPYVWGRDFETEVDWKAAAPILIAALAARGIDLELAYQWHRAEQALPEGWSIERLWRNVGWEVRATDGRFDASVLRVTLVSRRGSTPAAALSALADALEAQK